jgi:hypothetical protein
VRNGWIIQTPERSKLFKPSEVGFAGMVLAKSFVVEMKRNETID